MRLALNVETKSRCGEGPVLEISLAGKNRTSLRIHVHEPSWESALGGGDADVDVELIVKHHDARATFGEGRYVCTGVVYYNSDGLLGASFGGLLGCIEDPSKTLTFDHYSEGDYVDFCFRKGGV